jgi:hypothetical protein
MNESFNGHTVFFFFFFSNTLGKVKMFEYRKQNYVNAGFARTQLGRNCGAQARAGDQEVGQLFYDTKSKFEK